MNAVRRKQFLTPVQNAALSSQSPVNSAPNAEQRGRDDDEKEQLKWLSHSWHPVRLGQCNCVCRPFGKNAVFWISYAFTLIAFAAQIVIWKSTLGRAESLKSKFLGFPVVHIGIVYAIIQTVAFAVFLLVPTLPAWSVIVVCSVIAGVSVVCMISADAGRNEIERVEAKVQKKVFYIRELQADIELLADNETNADVKRHSHSSQRKSVFPIL